MLLQKRNHVNSRTQVFSANITFLTASREYSVCALGTQRSTLAWCVCCLPPYKVVVLNVASCFPDMHEREIWIGYCVSSTAVVYYC